MKHSLTILAVMATASTSLVAQTSGIFQTGPLFPVGTYRQSTPGSLNAMTLCTHEVCKVNERGEIEILPIAASSISAIMAQAANPEKQVNLVFYPHGEEPNPRNRRILRNRYLLEVRSGADLEIIRQRCEIKEIRLSSPGSRFAVCEEETSAKVLAQLSNVLSDPDVISAEPLFARQLFKRFIPSDPFYAPNGAQAYQWYLNNEGVNGGVPGIDIGFLPEGVDNFSVLNQATGAGVTVGIIDDGLATDHTDLEANATGPHLNIREGGNDPATLDADLNHGTNLAGLIAAEVNNGEGISGVAPDASLAGIRLLGGPVDDSEEALALNFANDVISIYNGSWGTDDDVLTLDGPGFLAQQALQQGVISGRPDLDNPNNRLGSIFVWAAGNGGLIGDNSNYDGYAASRFTIAVGAVDDSGNRAVYSERGSNLVVSAPSGGGAQNLVTTAFELGLDQDDLPIRVPVYDPGFTGTSASAALVSGVVALMLEENPSLGWRDVQDVLIRTATKVDPSNGEWVTNAAGIEFNENYGAGLVNAAAAVQEARRVDTNNSYLPPVVRQSTFRSFDDSAEPGSLLDGSVPDNTGDSLVVNFDMTQDSEGNPLDNLRVEHVELNATIVTNRRSDLEIVLVSPNGTTSTLQTTDPVNDEQSIFNWTFMTVRNWGEGSSGVWVLRVTDRTSGNPAVVSDLSLIINGTPDPDAPVGNSPVLTSPRFVEIDEGSAFSYRVEQLGATSIEVGELPSGLIYDEITNVISGVPTRPGLYSTPIILRSDESDDGIFTLNFEIRPTAVALGDAIGLPNRLAFVGGDAPWAFELVESSDPVGEEGRSARSAVNLGDNEQSIFGFNNLSQGVIMWDWKVSSEEGFDRLWFNLGGDVPQSWEIFIDGERDWRKAAALLPNASNNVRWIYSKDGSTSVGEDRGLVDNVELMTIEKYREEVIAAANIEGFDFEINSRALFIPTTLDGASPPPGGGPLSSLISPALGNGQTASIAGWVEGPGTFSFLSLNYADTSDVIEVLVDGALVNFRSGAGGGGTATLFNPIQQIPAGRHRVEVRFRKDFSGSFGAVWPAIGAPFDGVVIDDLKFVPANNFNNFMAGYGSEVDLSPDGDIDSDGYSNHTEYAFGGSLTVSDIPKYLPKTVIDGTQSYIEFGFDRDRSDLSYVAEESQDLVNWTAAKLVTFERSEGSVDFYRIPVASGPGRRELFYRVVARTK